ncbi:MAG: sugar phosphate isomerase/epimerase family protein [Candidatus Acetothermia bacterium]
MEYVVSTWSFRHDKLPVALDKIAGLKGINHLELVAHEPCLSSEFEFTTESIETIRNLLSDSDLELVTLSPYTDFLHKETHEREVKRGEDMLEVAQSLGARFLRVFIADTAPQTQSDEENTELASSALERLAAKAFDRGIKLTVETHGKYGCSVSNLCTILNSIEGPQVGVTLDSGNLYNDGKDPVEVTQELLSYIDYLHLKDFLCTDGELQDCPLGRGEIQNEEILRILETSGYDGFICPEYEGDQDPAGSLRESLEYLRNLK